jgi:uncharacterized membrane protein YeaQ/YmgE (transglycosylase-associated protein family)
MGHGRRFGPAEGSMAERTILGWLLIGLVAGVLAKLLTRGRDPGGIVVTVLIAQGMASSPLDVWTSYGAAIAGAVVLLVAYRIVIARRA